MATHKDIDPRGFLLNDNDTGVDHLGESTFAGAIADSIHHVDTPITIGLFARWGGGKSFLLRHVESILKRYEKQCAVDNKNRKGVPDEGAQCTHPKRAICWTMYFVVFVGMMLCTLMLAVSPEWYFQILGIDIAVPDQTLSTSENETTIQPTGAGSDDDVSSQPPEYLRAMKITGLVLIPVEIAIVFLVGCCGKKWLSMKYYGSCRLLTYGAFTKLPVRDSSSDVVEDPGQLPAQVLNHIPPGDERLAMAAAEAEMFPRKYIFVDFKAWEYHGSDTLWAGIVTNIMDAVEGEFGVITARMFRMLKIEKVPQNISEEEARTMYIHLVGDPTNNEVLDMMKQYGVVKGCTKVGTSRSRGKNWWKVVYSNDGECRNAKECLAIEGVEYSESDPLKTQTNHQVKKKRRKTSRKDSSKRLLQQEVIEMNQIPKTASGFTDNQDALDRLTLPPKSRFCGRFCSHFLKYPTKLLCVPRLVWWILIILCSILIPIIAYVIATYFNLNVYKTYRIVPVYGQILIWLPAGLATTVFITKFIWAMCHSQRKRIDQALDGSRTKMAVELGFMSKVKSEIDVVTRLIQCARFTHQTDYKIIITVDDLDRLSLKKVQSVLEAVGILLSGKSSPFICIIAVDPRIVVKCIEEGMGDVLLKSKITGHEYLKKIINLPICLPEITDAGKKRYIAGLIDQADHTVTYREEVKKSRTRTDTAQEETTVDHPGRSTIPHHRASNGRPHSWAPMINDFVDGKKKLTMSGDKHQVSVSITGVPIQEISLDIPLPQPPENSSTTSQRRTDRQYSGMAVEISHDEFLFHCREFMYHDEDLHKHMHGNPRNIKRLFNVISLTACIINSFSKRQKRRNFIQSHAANETDQGISNESNKIVRTKELAESLVRWILMTDQWPYRTSYILQVIEDSEQRTTAGLEKEKIPEEWTIFEIFQNKVKEECENGDAALLSLDADPDLFYSFISLLKDKNFTIHEIQNLQKYTVNLDYSVRHSIAFQRDLSCLSPDAKSDGNDVGNQTTPNPNTAEENKTSKPAEVVVDSKQEEFPGQLCGHERHYSMPNILVHA